MSKSTLQIYIVVFFMSFLFLAVSAGNASTDVSNTGSGVDNSSLSITHSLSSFSGDTPPSSGDWIVTSASTCISETVYVNGSIIVQSGGTLAINGSYIYFNQEGKNITVEAGGSLVIGTTTIATASSINSYSLDFHTTGTAVYVNIEDSTIQDFSVTDIAITSGLVEFNNVNFRNWTATAIDINYGDVNIINCDFYDPDGSSSTYYSGNLAIKIDTLVGDHTIIDSCTFRNLYMTTFGQYVIYEGPSATGYTSITNNEFYDILDSDGSSGDSTLIEIVADNTYIDSNHFYNNWGIPISAKGDNITISNNNFESHYDYNVYLNGEWESPCAIILVTGTENLIEKNRIFDWPGSGIVAASTSFNNTIRDNFVQDVADAGIYFIDQAHNYTVTGNLIASSNIGLDVGPENQNLTIYKNAFVNETIYAVDRNSTARGISWDNGTYGNVWTNYTGLDSNNDWVGDSIHNMSVAYNVTDSYPALMIGEFAPSSGTWTIDTPHMFYTKDVGDVYVDTFVDGVAGTLLIIYSDMNIDNGLTITLNDESSLFLYEASIQVRTLSGSYNFIVNDMFNWYSWDSTISNVTASLTIETRFFNSLGCAFYEIPGMEVTMYAYHNRTYQGAIPVTIQDNIFHNITGDIKIHREMEFTNNSITFEVPASAHWVQLTEWDESNYLEPCLVEGNIITGGRLNVSAGYSTCNVTDNYAELGLLIDIFGLSDSYFNISGNTADQNEMNIYVKVDGSSTSAYVEMNNNTLDSGTLTIWCNGGDHAGFEMSYATHNSGTTNIDYAIYGTIAYFNHGSGTTNVVNGSDATMDHCTLGGDLDVTNSGYFKFLNGYVGGNTNVDYSDGSHFNSTDFNDGFIYLYNSPDVVVAHNDFSGYRGGSDGQIRTFRSDYCTIYDNDFLNSTDSIRIMYECDFVVVEKNNFELVDGYAISIVEASYNLTVRNNVFNGGTNGLIDNSITFRNDNMTIINNVFANITGNAIHTYYSSWNTISFNTIYNISGHGIYTDHGNYHTIHSNSIWNVSATGITTFGNNLSLAHNIINDCGTIGVFLGYSGSPYYYVVIQNNTITNCGSHGLYSDSDYHEVTIFNNTLAFNGGWGYKADDLDDSLLYFNYYYCNGEGSLYLWWGTGNQLDNGTVGNFYEEYRGVESGTPWIGATPFEVRGANNDVRGIDNHPIMGMGVLTPATGDWIIDELTIILGVVRSIDGDIIITSTGNLTLAGTQITFATGGSYWSTIEVQGGGSLIMIDGAKLTANTIVETYSFGFQTGATIRMHDITIDRCGYPSGSPGFYVNITTVELGNLTLSNSPDYCMYIDSVSIELSDIVIINTNYGINAQYAHNSNLTNLYFDNCNTGVFMRLTNSLTLSGLEFHDTSTGIQFITVSNSLIENSDFEGCTTTGIAFSDADSITIYNCKFVDNPTGISISAGSDGSLIYFNFFSGETTYINDGGIGTILNNGTYGNFYLEYSGVDVDGNLIGDTPYNFGSNTDTLPLMVWGSWPSTNPGWYVTVDTWCLATNFTLNGDVTIYSGATLLVYDATLWFNCSSDHEYGFFINDGGAIYYYDGGLRAYDVTYQFDVHAYPESLIHFDGVLLNGSYQISIDSNSTYLNNMNLYNVYNGIYLTGNLYGITVTDCAFTDVENTGIYVSSCTETTITGCVFTNIGNQGINLWYSADSDIVGCTFTGVNDGVYMVVSTNTLLDSLSFATVADDAIYATACTDITIQNLQVTNAHTGVYISNRIYGGLSVYDSVFDNVQNGIYFNIFTHDAATLIVDNMTVSNVAQYGINAQYLGNVTIIDSEFNVHGGIMIRVYLSVDWFNIEGCQGFNGSTGIYVYDGTGMIDNCDISNFTTGILLQHFSGNPNMTISGSDFLGCDNAINMESASYLRATITYNQFTDCDYAVYRSKGSNLVFTYNIVTDAYMGLDVYYAGSNYYIAHNSYTDCDFPVHLLESGSNFTIEYETIVNADDGIYMWNTDDVTVLEVTISGCSAGLAIAYCENVSLSDIDVSFASAGFSIYNTINVTMRDCVVSNIDQYPVQVTASNLDEAAHDIDLSNTYEGKPIYYIANISNYEYNNLDTSYLILLYCDNVTINDSTIGGIKSVFKYLDNCTLVNSTISTSLQFIDCEDMLIIGNDLSDSETIDSYQSGCVNVTFTLNSFLTAYSFGATGFNLNASEYGNYWYNYVGTDDDQDGIGDQSHNIASGRTDYLPLIAPRDGYTAIPEIIIPVDEDVVAGEVSVSFDTVLLLGIYYEGTPSVAVTVDVNGTDVYTGTTEGTIDFTFDSTDFADGLYILLVTVVVDGSDTYSVSIEITIDNTGPVITTSMEDEEIYTYNSVGIVIHATDEYSSAEWIAFYIDSVLQENYTGSSIGYYSSVYLTFASEGQFILNFTSADSLGNINSVTRTVYYDISDPAISGPSTATYEEGTTGNTVTIMASDLTPSHYNVTIVGVTGTTGYEWSGGDIVINIDGFSVGSHYMQIAVHDGAYHTSYLSITITVTEGSTTSTSTTTTTTTTDTTTGTTTPPPPDDGMMMIVLVIGGAAGAIVVVIVIIMMKKKNAA